MRSRASRWRPAPPSSRTRSFSTVGDVGLPPEARLSALDALVAFEAQALPAVVQVALGDPDGRVRASALAVLEELAPGEALPSLPAILAHGELEERRAGYRILAGSVGEEATLLFVAELEKLVAGLLPAELTLDLVEAVEAHAGEAMDPRLAELLERHRAPRALDPELAPHLDVSLWGRREAWREGLPARRSFLRTLSLGGRRRGAVRSDRTWPGSPGGSPASRCSSRSSPRTVARHRVSAPPSSSWEEGGIVNGRILEETEAFIRVLDSEGEVIDVDPLDVEERRADLSAMPEDLVQSMTARELRDLLAYLASL